MLRRCLKILFVLGAVCATTLASAAPAIWQVQGRHNTVYLLGTIHVLRADEPLPTNIRLAYREAEQVLMEIDMDDVDPMATQGLMFKLGLLPAGQRLESQLDAATHRKLQAAASSLGIDASMLSSFQPWLAALTLEQLQLAKLGFATEAGIEMQLTQQAIADRKPIHGLETLEQQLNLFAQMDDQAQRDYLDYTLTELGKIPTEVESLLTAWRSGDEKHLSEMLQQGLADDPKLFTALTTTRNRRWITAIKPLLDTQHDDYLIAVGALHLFGDEGLVALLKRAGYKVTRQ